MSTAILPDDSVVIRLPRETIHLCAKTRSINVRAAHPRKELGGSMLASYPLSAAERVRLTKSPAGRVWILLDLRSGRSLGLGDAPSQDVGMLTARMIADLTRCKVEVGAGEVPLRPDVPLEEPTRRIPWEDDTITRDEPDTDPPEGFTPEDAPVFMDLLRESEFLAAQSPLVPEPRSVQRRGSSGKRLRAVLQVLRLTAESLPSATDSLADMPFPRPT